MKVRLRRERSIITRKRPLDLRRTPSTLQAKYGKKKAAEEAAGVAGQPVLKQFAPLGFSAFRMW